MTNLIIRRFPEVIFGDGEKGRILVDKGITKSGDLIKRRFLIQISDVMVRKGQVKREGDLKRGTLYEIGAFPRKEEGGDIEVLYVEREFFVSHIKPLSIKQYLIFTNLNGIETDLLKDDHFRWLDEKKIWHKELLIKERIIEKLQYDNKILQTRLAEWVKMGRVIKEERGEVRSNITPEEVEQNG